MAAGGRSPGVPESGGSKAADNHVKAPFLLRCKAEHMFQKLCGNAANGNGCREDRG